MLKVPDKYRFFDKMLEGVQLIGRDFRYLYVNQAIANQGKTTIENLIGRTMPEVYPGIENTMVFRRIRNCLEDGKASQFINQFEFPDKSMGWFDIRMEPVEDGVFLFTFDITEQKKLEEELKTLNEELAFKVREKTKELSEFLERERELNRIKSRFVSMASHECRTPLSTILSSASLIEKYEQTEQQAQRVKHIKRIKYSVLSLNNLLDEFLSLEKLELGVMSVHFTDVDVKTYVSNILEELEGISKIGQNIHYFHQGKAIAILEKQILRNVLLNLLSNAIKYSESDIELHTLVNDDLVEVRVSDKGIGIPEKEQNNLFQRFFRASNALNAQGTGLGLNIVKKYLELIHGNITFTSKQNEGTTFTVYLSQKSLVEEPLRVNPMTSTNQLK